MTLKGRIISRYYAAHLNISSYRTNYRADNVLLPKQSPFQGCCGQRSMQTLLTSSDNLKDWTSRAR